MTTNFGLKIPDELNKQLGEAATLNKRSKTMEAIHRLEQSFATPTVLYSYPTALTSINTPEATS
jgi:hypothetical protein